MMKVLGDNFGVEKSLMSTIHSYTSTQAIIDGMGKKGDFRRGRAAALNIIPASTGAALATTLAIPDLKGNFDGMAFRVPTPVGSVSDIVVVTEKDTTEEEVNQAFIEAADGKMKGILEATDEPLVSQDIVGDSHSVVTQLDLTKVIGGNLVKVVGWYDNEWGYSSRLIDVAKRMGA
jgi:glyceraldehyde 3-phosphate dehydrogenase